MKLTISAKLGVMAAIGALSAAGIAWLGHAAITASGSASSASAPASRAVYLHGNLDMMHDATRSDVLSSLIAADAAEVEAAARDLQEHKAEIDSVMAELGGLELDDSLKAQIRSAQKPLADYVNAASDIIGLARTDRTAAHAKLAAFQVQFGALEESLGSLGESVQTSATAAVEATAAEAGRAANKLIGVASVALVLIGIGSFAIARTIVSGLRTIGEAAESIASGRLDVDVTYTAEDELGSLADQFREMARQLSEAMLAINQSAEQVANSSSELSSASRNLADSATSSAAAIQEVGASTAETTQRSNAASEQIEATRSLSHDVRTSALRGDQQMKDMVKAISEVDASAHDISKVIKVIDDIAFQINLLSLNAAVEAARAGEHGRGFAVVAEEVRNLATRSARAAHETTALIEGSISKARHGTTIAHVTAKALAEIVEKIGEMTALAENAATNTREQRKSIEAVNGAIERVDESVQSNTASAEEMAATATELSQQADELRRVVGQFKLKDDGSRPPRRRAAKSAAPEARRARGVESEYAHH